MSHTAVFNGRGILTDAADFSIGHKILAGMNLLCLAQPVMERLAVEFDESVYLAVPSDRHLLMLARAVGSTKRSDTSRVMIGQRYRLPDTEIGRIMLSFQSAGDVTGKKMEMANLRRRGAVIDYNGLGEGITSLAVPLLSGVSTLHGCLCLLGSADRLSAQRIQMQLLPGLKKEGRKVSAILDHLKPPVSCQL